ncbi:putative endonuclease [Persephonella hydrogeniphila]|uniref:UPF0102 protein SAMN06265182_1633 n=1 Tax=Persephonella hydrogeniphila TaxID=198703 RepID=A0A285NKU4_9AQUI|nr:YraN family protein [Persephonella hydrogeniphila]SNZ09848.1 putative endonuclease [Persephonella hydrogeniphila]
MKSSDIGKIFEDKAVEFLKEKGYRILDRNFRTRTGEIDIVAKDKDTVVFVEVRYRKNLSFGFPEETVNRKKMKNILSTANRYISMKNFSDFNIRFDVIAIDEKDIRHIKNAFDMDCI